MGPFIFVLYCEDCAAGTIYTCIITAHLVLNFSSGLPSLYNCKDTVTLPSAASVEATTFKEESIKTSVYVRFGLPRLKMMFIHHHEKVSTTVFWLYIQNVWQLNAQ